MRLDGIYTGPDVNVPDGIRATGTHEEFDRVGPLPAHSGTWREDGQSVDLPADKGVVQEIARKVEVECQDRRLIDWMAQG